MRKVFLSLAIAVAFMCGCALGAHHAINDSVIYAVDVYNPEIPDMSAYTDPKTGELYDQAIFIELDGHTYVHGIYQG